MDREYQMGFGAEILPGRVEFYKSGRMDQDDIVLFYQDLLEAGMLPPDHMERAVGLLQNGLIHAIGRALH